MIIVVLVVTVFPVLGGIAFLPISQQLFQKRPKLKLLIGGQCFKRIGRCFLRFVYMCLTFFGQADLHAAAILLVLLPKDKSLLLQLHEQFTDRSGLDAQCVGKLLLGNAWVLCNDCHDIAAAPFASPYAMGKAVTATVQQSRQRVVLFNMMSMMIKTVFHIIPPYGCFL